MAMGQRLSSPGREGLGDVGALEARSALSLGFTTVTLLEAMWAMMTAGAGPRAGAVNSRI